MTDILLSSLDADGILRLTMNDGARRNPLSEAMLDALRVAFDTATSDRGVRVVVLAANGPAFCAGHDLKEIALKDRAAGRAQGFEGRDHAGFPLQIGLHSRRHAHAAHGQT